MGYMGDNGVWDIFCNVMLKKRDFPTISHITMGIGHHCAKVNVNDGHIFGGTMTENQRMDIKNLQTKALKECVGELLKNWRIQKR